MGSSFFGRPNMGGSSPSSSSPTTSSSSPGTRRGKKNGSEKPKQPQRGLGVAQLEKIRLHGEMSCNSFNNYNPSLYPQDDIVRMQGGYASIPSSSPSQPSAPYGYHPNMMMGVHRDQYETATMSWNPSYGILESQHSSEPNITTHFLHEEDIVRMQGGYASIPSSSPSQPSAPYGYHPNMMMGVHRDQYETATMSWNPSYGILESQHSSEPNITTHFKHEDSSSTRRSKSLGSGTQKSGSSENQELDLELRLSL